MTRIMLLALCIVSVGSVVRFCILSDFLRTDLSVLAESRQADLVAYIAHDLDIKIQQRQALLERLAADLPPDVLSHPVQLHDWLQERYQFQTLFSGGLFVVDPQGMPLGSFPLQHNPKLFDYSVRDDIKTGQSDRRMAGRIIEGRDEKQAVLPLAVAVKDASGTVRAMLVGVTLLNDRSFLAPLQSLRLGYSGGKLLLVSPRDHLLMTADQKDAGLLATPPAGRDALMDNVMTGFKGEGVATTADGVEMVYAIAPVSTTGWSVVAMLPGSEAFATIERVRQLTWRNAGWIMLIFLSFAGVYIYFLFRPLFHAARQAEAMACGDSPLVALPVVRHDELGHLLAAFNRLLSKLDAKQSELSDMALHDTLTGLPNRIALSDRLSRELASSLQTGVRLAVVYLDLDGFKQINDTLGHDAGDTALREVARRLSRIPAPDDMLARIGGDEFVLLLGKLGEGAEAYVEAMALRCHEAMEAPFEIAGRIFTLGVSVGVALGDGRCEADALLLSADHAMYQAKKNRVEGYEMVKESASRSISTAQLS